MHWTSRRSDSGSATVLTIALSFILLSAGFVGLALVQVHLVATHVQSAADLAALAGAQARDDPCRRAADIAVANGVEISDCTFDGTDVIVQVRVQAPPMLERMARLTGQAADVITAVARAGPPST
jgi:secretion/DNA translocation related TadE-like protein